MNPGHQDKRHPAFHCTTTMFASLCQVLIVLYICILCFNLKKKRRRNWGFEPGSPRQEPSALPVRQTLVLGFPPRGGVSEKNKVPDAGLEPATFSNLQLSSKNEGALPLHHRWFFDNCLGCHYITKIMYR